ncbi:hypothetical protein [Pygmaiobacter massiliensis]|uniref:hypothetical protein n=1 Tax=Pygmaiobacter massiliensis TaxID=1917873 RepID=UPI00289EB3E0|nr:hypothetical protein [Pygmaiobacter massiliensis]
MNPLFVGIDVSCKNNVTYLMKPNGSKHNSFSVQNNLGGAKLMSEKIVSALEAMQLSNVVDWPGGHVHLWGWPGLRPPGRWAAGAVSEKNPRTQSQADQEIQGLLSRPA